MSAASTLLPCSPGYCPSYENSPWKSLPPGFDDAGPGKARGREFGAAADGGDLDVVERSLIEVGHRAAFEQPRVDTLEERRLFIGAEVGAAVRELPRAIAADVDRARVAHARRQRDGFADAPRRGIESRTSWLRFELMVVVDTSMTGLWPIP